ncbi:hypothetical protein [Rossellomorea marisflavi]|uniref:hypothetical protein n=1 Tax=Rossellomorea marisflavi TaxID=189381 RepID=UPI003459B856
MVKKWIVILTACGLLSACGLGEKNETASKTEAATDEKKAKASEDEKATNEKEASASKAEADKPQQEKPLKTFDELTPEELKIPTVPMESPYGEDGNFKYVHTDKELARDFTDENNMIRFDLDEDPIRIMRTGNVDNVMNYSDTFIDLSENLSYKIQDPEKIEIAYQLFIDHPPVQLQGKEGIEYRSWEEATNMERGIIQMTILLSVPMNYLQYAIEQDEYDTEQFKTAQAEFKRIGDPMVLFPSPQTPLDYELYESIRTVHALWGKLGLYQKPEQDKEEFKALYDQTRQEVNNLFARVNYTLSEE